MKCIFINLGGMERIILAEKILSVEIVNAMSIGAEEQEFVDSKKWRIVITYESGDRNVIQHHSMEHYDKCAEMVRIIAKKLDCVDLFENNDPAVKKTAGSSNPRTPKRDRFNDR